MSCNFLLHFSTFLLKAFTLYKTTLNRINAGSMINVRCSSGIMCHKREFILDLQAWSTHGCIQDLYMDLYKANKKTVFVQNLRKTEKCMHILCKGNNCCWESKLSWTCINLKNLPAILQLIYMPFTRHWRTQFRKYRLARKMLLIIRLSWKKWKLASCQTDYI